MLLNGSLRFDYEDSSSFFSSASLLENCCNLNPHESHPQLQAQALTDFNDYFPSAAMQRMYGSKIVSVVVLVIVDE